MSETLNNHPQGPDQYNFDHMFEDSPEPQTSAELTAAAESAAVRPAAEIVVDPAVEAARQTAIASASREATGDPRIGL